jgi:transposase
MKKYVVNLSEKERKRLVSIVSKGANKAAVIRRAHTLLKSDAGKTDEEIGALLYVDSETVRSTRMRYCEGGLDAALEEKAGRGNAPKLNEQQATYLVALACTDAPHGQARWTLEMLAKRLVEDGIVESIAPETVRLVLQKKA